MSIEDELNGLLSNDGELPDFEEEINIPAFEQKPVKKKEITDRDPAIEEMENEVNTEFSKALTGFKERAKREDQRFTDATDSEYWIAIVFQNREQKEEFIKKIGFDIERDNDKYMDGIEVAEKLNIKLETPVPQLPHYRAFDREYIDMAFDVEDQ